MDRRGFIQAATGLAALAIVNPVDAVLSLMADRQMPSEALSLTRDEIVARIVEMQAILDSQAVPRPRFLILPPAFDPYILGRDLEDVSVYVAEDAGPRLIYSGELRRWS